MNSTQDKSTQKSEEYQMGLKHGEKGAPKLLRSEDYLKGYREGSARAENKAREKARSRCLESSLI